LRLARPGAKVPAMRDASAAQVEIDRLKDEVVRLRNDLANRIVVSESRLMWFLYVQAVGIIATACWIALLALGAHGH
jgi:hypothetical protein